MRQPLLEVRELKTSFSTQTGDRDVVCGVSFSIQKGVILGLVGESGSGKTMMALSVMRLLPPAARISSGSVLLDGMDLSRCAEERMEAVRGGRIGMVFQDPLSSFNPVYRIGRQIAEAVRAHRDNVPSVTGEVLRLLRLVEMPSPEQVAEAYPHQLSGGMRQRAMIAMALAGSPDLLIADEPTTALDVTVQAQILDLLRRLQQKQQMAVLLITHDLGVLAAIADELLVMHRGRIVEAGEAESVMREPSDPYTRQLLAAVPRLEVS